MNESKYAQIRLRNGFGNDRSDDRDCSDKKMLDAELRGSIGRHRANQVIASIDGLKSIRGGLG